MSNDYGLKLLNNNNEILIDSTYRNFSLDESGAATISSSSIFNYITLTSSPLVPIILIRPNSSYYSSIYGLKKSGSNFISFCMITESNNVTIDWQSYRENRVIPSNNHGLIVYNSSGNICYHSGNYYFKIREVHSMNLDNPTIADPGKYTDIEHSTISNPYYFLNYQSAWWSQCIPQGGYSGWRLLKIGLKRISSTSVRVGWYTFKAGVTSPGISVNTGVNPTISLLVCN